MKRVDKVLFIGPYPPPYAGPEISMKYLLESPLSQRFDVSFLNTNVRKSNAKKGNIDIFLVWAFFLLLPGWCGCLLPKGLC